MATSCGSMGKVSLSLLIYTRYTPLVIVPFSSLGLASHFSRTACFSQNGDPVACPLALSSSPSIHDSNWWCRARSSAQFRLYTHTLTARVALPICGVLRLQNWSLDWDGILHYDMPVLEILFVFHFFSPFFKFLFEIARQICRKREKERKKQGPRCFSVARCNRYYTRSGLFSFSSPDCLNCRRAYSCCPRNKKIKKGKWECERSIVIGNRPPFNGAY